MHAPSESFLTFISRDIIIILYSIMIKFQLLIGCRRRGIITEITATPGPSGLTRSPPFSDNNLSAKWPGGLGVRTYAEYRASLSDADSEYEHFTILHIPNASGCCVFFCVCEFFAYFWRFLRMFLPRLRIMRIQHTKKGGHGVHSIQAALAILF